MKQGVIGRLGRALGLLPDEVPVASNVVVPARFGAFGEGEFLRSLRKMAAGQPKVLTGSVNFLGLSAIREKVGDRWPKLAERADQLARRAIERRLLPCDVFTALEDFNYLIVFSTLTEEAARLKCSLIGLEIEKVLLGENLPRNVIDVKTAVTMVEREKILEHLQEAEPALSSPPQELDPPADAPSSPAGMEAGPAAYGRPQRLYRPIWDVKKGAVASFLCEQPAREVGKMPSSEEDLEQAEKSDHAVLYQVNDQLRAIAQTRRRMILGAPVHVETLMRNIRRATYINQCHKFLDFHERLVIFEVVGNTDGLPHSRLPEISSYLKPFARAVLLRLPLDQASFSWVANAGILAVGVHLGAHPRSEALTLKAMSRFAENANKFGLLTYAHGIASPSLASGAIGAGFNYVAGDAVAPAGEDVGQVHRFNLVDVYAK